jgi:hypothetical protein
VSIENVTRLSKTNARKAISAGAALVDMFDTCTHLVDMGEFLTASYDAVNERTDFDTYSDAGIERFDAMRCIAEWNAMAYLGLRVGDGDTMVYDPRHTRYAVQFQKGWVRVIEVTGPHTRNQPQRSVALFKDGDIAKAFDTAVKLTQW